MSVRVTAATRVALAQRSGGRCEVGWAGCDGRGEEASHRRPVRAGGTSLAARNGPDNLVHACARCHRTLESQRTRALCLGLLLHGELSDPAGEPVFLRSLYGTGWFLLAADGGMTGAADPGRDCTPTAVGPGLTASTPTRSVALDSSRLGRQDTP